jgi:Frag1/DRAM/Sfk1 family
MTLVRHKQVARSNGVVYHCTPCLRVVVDAAAAATRRRRRAAVVTGAVTYAACRIMAHVNGTYLGNLAFPFFSDTGRDKPAYYVFVTGAAVEAVLVLASLWCVYHRLETWLHEIRGLDLIPVGRWLDALCTVGCLFGAAAQPLLVTAAACDTSHHPRVHQMAADSFFCLSTISLLCFVSHMWIYACSMLVVPVVSVLRSVC